MRTSIEMYNEYLFYNIYLTIKCSFKSSEYAGIMYIILNKLFRNFNNKRNFEISKCAHLTVLLSYKAYIYHNKLYQWMVKIFLYLNYVKFKNNCHKS